MFTLLTQPTGFCDSMTQGHIADIFTRAPDTRLRRQLRQIQVLPQYPYKSNWTTISPSGIAPQVTKTGSGSYSPALIYKHDQRCVLSLTTRDIPRLGVKFLLPSGVSGSSSFTWEPSFASHRASRYSAVDATAPAHLSLDTPGYPQAARVQLRHFLALSYHSLLPP
jgi:hypothetical protein